MIDTSSQSAVSSFLVLVLYAAAIVIVIWFLWALPAWLKRGSHRPGEPWVGDPLWVGAPTDERAAIGAAPSSQVVQASDLAAIDPRGGASARW